MTIYDINLIKIKNDIINDNKEFTNLGYFPLYYVNSKSKILIIGQAPGIKARDSNSAWNDQSGDTLRDWLGVTRNEFYNEDLFGIIPMDFYYPGKGKSGDLPPRKEFAKKWHPLILENLKDIKLIILIGNYAQKYYLNNKDNLTNNVFNYKKYLPLYFPIVHPSPLNFRWINKNPWFISDVVPELKKLVRNIINKENSPLY